VDDHILKEQFLLEFFGNFGRDLGSPERYFTNNPTVIFTFIAECTENKLPAFMSVQPEKSRAHPLGIEKLFFDFDYCKKSEILTDAETQKRRTELIDEVKHFLKQLDLQNIKPLIIRTRRGFHVHVFFDSIYEITDDLEFWKQVYKQLQYSFLQDQNYRFIDHSVLGDINRMCRIPLSIHEKSGEEPAFPVPDVPIDKNDLRYVSGYILPHHFPHPVTGKPSTEGRHNARLKPLKID